MQFFLYFVIFVEGFIVLSSEIVAIRQLVPFAGGGSDLIAIVISAVLMPLAWGYYIGGEYKVKEGQEVETQIRTKLTHNFLLAALFLTVALSNISVSFVFDVFLRDSGLDRLAQAAIFCACFLVYPVYLLGQTIPLLSHLFKKDILPHVTGHILFFSTIGSFLGAILTSLVMMAFFGVHYTVSIIILSLIALAFAISPKTMIKDMVTPSIILAALVLVLNSGFMMSQFGIVSNNAYNKVRFVEFETGQRVLMINNNHSSGWPEPGHYIEHINRLLIDPISKGDLPQKDILILGAGGFTAGANDQHNKYTYVDIDGSLKEIAETYLLRQMLAENKDFVTQPARRFVSEAAEKDTKYDFILVDVFRGYKAPEQVVTIEFFETVKKLVKPNGRIALNITSCANLADTFSMRIDNTVRAVFPNINALPLPYKNYDAWNMERRLDEKFCDTQMLYIYVDQPKNDGSIYTDNKNQSFIDQ